MRPMHHIHRFETHEQWRQRALDETSRFIEWGLAHSEKVEWIPRHPVGRGAFTERMKTVFWNLIAQHADSFDEPSNN